jgi:large subunit ribosomal protein L15
MATRLRKTRKLRGGRHMGWGQVAQHRSFGHKGGLGRSGHLKHLASTVIKEDQDHFGHESTHRPISVSIITKKWINVRDLDDLFAKAGKSESSKNILDLTSLEIDKLLGGGKVTNAYTIKVKYASISAQEKVKQSGGEVTLPVKKINKNTEVPLEEKKTEDVENSDD